jgi:hypothetical protein
LIELIEMGSVGLGGPSRPAPHPGSNPPSTVSRNTHPPCRWRVSSDVRNRNSPPSPSPRLPRP